MIELLGHLGDPALGDPLDPELPHQALDPTRRDASEVGLADDLDEGPLGAPARLEQPVGEVATLPQLRDGQIDRAGPGVPGPGPVAVSTVSPIFRALPVRSPADRIDFLAHQPLTEELYRSEEHTSELQSREN